MTAGIGYAARQRGRAKRFSAALGLCSGPLPSHLAAGRTLRDSLDAGMQNWRAYGLVVLAGGAKPRLWLSLAKNIYSDLVGGPRQRDLHNSSRRARDRAANAWRHTSKQP